MPAPRQNTLGLTGAPQHAVVVVVCPITTPTIQPMLPRLPCQPLPTQGPHAAGRTLAGRTQCTCRPRSAIQHTQAPETNLMRAGCAAGEWGRRRSEGAQGRPMHHLCRRVGWVPPAGWCAPNPLYRTSCTNMVGWWLRRHWDSSPGGWAGRVTAAERTAAAPPGPAPAAWELGLAGEMQTVRGAVEGLGMR